MMPGLVLGIYVTRVSLLAKETLYEEGASDDYYNSKLSLMYLCLAFFEVGTGFTLGSIYDKYGLILYILFCNYFLGKKVTLKILLTA